MVAFLAFGLLTQLFMAGKHGPVVRLVGDGLGLGVLLLRIGTPALLGCQLIFPLLLPGCLLLQLRPGLIGVEGQGDRDS